MSIGVVIPAYRCADTIARTIGSCLPHVGAQNIIVAFDGPDEAAERAVRAVSDELRILVLPNRSGAPACRNAGMALLDAEYVIFLDADDYIEGPMLEGAIRAAGAEDADVVLSPFCFEFPDGERRLFDPKNLYPALDRVSIIRKWLTGGYTPPCAVVWRTRFLRAMGGWDESLAKNQDGDLMYRALMQGARVAAASQGLGVYVQSGNPDRITRSNTERTLRSQLAVLDRVRVNLPKLQNAPSRELSHAYYSLARLAYEGGADAIGYRAESRARELGLVGQTGAPAHVLLASILGLRGKQRLAGFVRRSVRNLAARAR
ncbi:MAG: glycosyltransferase family 2 protein [Rhodoblastus sp.]